MHHRHLLPDEFDLLLDEGTGFGLKPLREHVRGCPGCGAELAEARRVVDALSELRPLVPRMGLADRVMQHVPVFVPWHVAARDAMRRWVPTGQLARALAATIVAVVGSVLTGATLWLATRGDMLALFGGLAGEQARGAVADAAGGAVVALFGPQLIQSVQQTGAPGILLAAGGFVLSSAVTVFGLRSIAASRRARS